MDGIVSANETAVVVVERYWPRVTVEAFRRLPPMRQPTGITSLAAIVVPSDEVVLSLFVGAAEAVAEANRRERLPFIRVLPATLVVP